MSNTFGTSGEDSPAKRSVALFYEDEERALRLGDAIYAHGLNVVALRLNAAWATNRNAERILGALDPSGVICEMSHAPESVWRQFKEIYATPAASDLPFIVLTDDVDSVPEETTADLAIEVLSSGATTRLLLDILGQWQAARPTRDLRRPVWLDAASLQRLQSNASSPLPADVR